MGFATVRTGEAARTVAALESLLGIPLTDTVSDRVTS